MTTSCSSAATTRRQNAKSLTAFANGSAGGPATSSTWATSPTRAARRCFWRCGCGYGVCWKRHTSTSTWFAESETKIRDMSSNSSPAPALPATAKDFLYHEEATNMQAALGEPVRGRQAIHDNFAAFFRAFPDSYAQGRARL